MFKKNDFDENRFEVVHKELVDFNGVLKILRDKETGVNYMLIHQGAGASMTPLLDSDGKVVVTK